MIKKIVTQTFKNVPRLKQFIALKFLPASQIINEQVLHCSAKILLGLRSGSPLVPKIRLLAYFLNFTG